MNSTDNEQIGGPEQSPAVTWQNAAAAPVAVTAERRGAGGLVYFLAGIGGLTILGLAVVGLLSLGSSDGDDAVVSSPTSSLALRGLPAEGDDSASATEQASVDTANESGAGTEPTVPATTAATEPDVEPDATDPAATSDPADLIADPEVDPASIDAEEPAADETPIATPVGDVAIPDDPTAPGGPLSDNPNSGVAIVRGTMMFLEGAVPTQEWSDRIEALAAEVLGEQNVINNYIIKPTANEPSGGGNIIVEDSIEFAPDSARLAPSSEDLLNRGLFLFNIRPGMTMTVVGHTDSAGSSGGNQRLSERRAIAVQDWYIAQGIDPLRINTIGRGEEEPIASNDTEEGRAQNRRIQFLLENIFTEE